MIRLGFVGFEVQAILQPLDLTFERPHLDYAVLASAPYLKKDNKLIKRLQ